MPLVRSTRFGFFPSLSFPRPACYRIFPELLGFVNVDFGAPSIGLQGRPDSTRLFRATWFLAVRLHAP